MSRSALPRCVAAFVLVLCLLSRAPAWAAGKSLPEAPSAAPAAAQHAGALATVWSWLQALVGKAAAQPGGRHFVIDAGLCNDPNGGHCG